MEQQEVNYCNHILSPLAAAGWFSSDIQNLSSKLSEAAACFVLKIWNIQIIIYHCTLKLITQDI